MSKVKSAVSAPYEWIIGIIGIGLGLFASVPNLHINPFLFLFLLALAILLESIPIPLDKVNSTLLLGLPVATMVVYGSASAVLIVMGAQLCSDLVTGQRPQLSTVVFNIGQQTLSALGMVIVYHLLFHGGVNPVFDWGMAVAACLGSIAFVILNHAFVHTLNAVRRTFEPSDVQQMLLSDGLSVAIVIPFAFLMIGLGPYHPLLAPLAMVPICMLSQTLRMYQRSTLLQRIYSSLAQLVDEFEPESICMSIAEIARGVTAAEGTAVYVLSPDGQELRVMATVPTDAGAAVPEVLPATSGGVVWNVLCANGWEYVPAMRRDPRCSHEESDAGWASAAVFSMRAKSEAQGVIVCFSSRPHAFSERWKYVSVLAMQASVVLANAGMYRQMQEQSRRDGATGLYNYRYFYEMLAHRMAESKYIGQPLTIAIVDVDYFKKVNDTYGHLAGDAVLRSIGQLLARMAGPDAIVARYGGEEFGAILSLDADAAFHLMENFRAAVVRHNVEVGQYRLKGTTVSIGLASSPLHSGDDRELLLKADSAMYWGAKQQGRNRTAIYSPALDAQLFVDALTGLYTYHFVNLRIREELAHGARRFGVICIDLAGFGHINTQFSFQMGDKVLQETSVVIKECLRHTELVCRFGGDEFLVVFPNITTTELEVIAERIDRAISSYRFVWDNHVVTYVRCHYAADHFESIAGEEELFTRVHELFADLHGASQTTYGW